MMHGRRLFACFLGKVAIFWIGVNSRGPPLGSPPMR